MAVRRKVVVAGALGVVGRALVHHLEGRSDTAVVGLSRRAPDFETGARFVPVDLRDREATASALAAQRDATHLVYAALYEKPDLVRGWFEPDHVETNVGMLRSLLDALDPAPLEHVVLLQGAKAYGAHLGRPIRVPAREHETAREHPNFYFPQEDLLRARARTAGFRWTIFRPQIALGVAAGSSMNVIATLGAYAVIARALGRPLSHPGHPHGIAECTDARLLARAIEWAWTSEAARDEVFNVANGDVVVWRELFPRLAELFDMELGEPAPRRLQEEMPKHAALWRDLARRENLRAAELDALIGLSWQYADLLWASPQVPDRPALLSTIKLRRAGFADCIDTEQSILELLEQMRSWRYLPPA